MPRLSMSCKKYHVDSVFIVFHKYCFYFNLSQIVFIVFLDSV
jgi:hypothetical protein